MQGSDARIQFTPDLLPSDVTGVTIYDQRSGQFEFHPGPIFATIVLADEINRASPKTQSALLEVMEEGHVTVDGVTPPGAAAVHGDRHPEPDRAGRHLPAARGAARPVPDEARSATRTRRSRSRCCEGAAAGRSPDYLGAVTDTDTVAQLVRLTNRVFVADPVYAYAVRLAVATRDHKQVRVGVSPGV